MRIQLFPFFVCGLLLAGCNLTKPAIALPSDQELSANWTDLLDPELSHWDIWMGVPHVSVKGLPEGTLQSENVHNGTPIGLNKDPKGVFTMIKEGDEDVLHVSGEIYAGLTSKKEYGDYHLQLQFKWGEKKWAPRLKAPRDNGLLYHCTGPHGAFWNVWMRCLEFQIQENDMGDLFCLAGANALAKTKGAPDNKSYQYAGNGDFNGVGDHFGNYRNQRSAPNEKPNGEWNTLDLYTIDGRAVHMVNGQVVNALKDAFLMEDGVKIPLERGFLQLQSEAAEGFFKNVRIRKLTEFPAEIAGVFRQ
ncbi:MAG: DUF1080 domain-containing protein [Bacteroidota bacterium]